MRTPRAAVTKNMKSILSLTPVRKRYLAGLAAALLLSAFFLREMYYVSYSSSTFDEGQYTAYGFSLLKTGDYRLANFKPTMVPIMAALPLFPAGARLDTDSTHWKNLDDRIDIEDVWPATLEFIHRNVIPPDTLLFYARLPIIFLALLLGLGVYGWSARLNGRAGGLLSLLLFTTSPNMLAHGGLVTEDLAFSAFAFGTIWLYYLYGRGRRIPHLIFAGVLLGLALNTKYTAALLIPALAGHALLERLSRKAGGASPRWLLPPLAVFAIGAAVLFSFYGFSHIGHYLNGLRATATHIDGGQMAFLNGSYSIDGFWYYFIYAILVKTPLPVLILAGIAAFSAFRERGSFAGRTMYFLLFPSLLLLSASYSNFHIGLRHVLPLYPFLFVFAGGALKHLKGRLALVLPAVLLLWQVGASASVHPYYLTYFNELAGGPSSGHRRLLDSNLDWGQDLKALKRYLARENVSDLVLSYYGSTLPGYLGREYQDLFSTIKPRSWHINSFHVEKEYLAVSATNLYGLYFREFGKDMFYWLRGREPRRIIGNNIRVYDITSDTRAHEHLANIYFLTGYPAHARHACRRALSLDPGSEMARFLQAMILIRKKSSEKEGLELMRKYMRDSSFSAPAALQEYLPAPLFRYRYFLTARHAAKLFRKTKKNREAAFMEDLAAVLSRNGTAG